MKVVELDGLYLVLKHHDFIKDLEALSFSAPASLIQASASGLPHGHKMAARTPDWLMFKQGEGRGKGQK